MDTDKKDKSVQVKGAKEFSPEVRHQLILQTTETLENQINEHGLYEVVDVLETVLKLLVPTHVRITIG